MKRVLIAVTCDEHRAEMLTRHPDYLVVFSAPDCTQRSVMDPRDRVGDGENVTAAPLLLKLDEVASQLRLSVRKVSDLIADGELDSVKVGGARRVRAVDLDAYVARLGEQTERITSASS